MKEELNDKPIRQKAKFNKTIGVQLLLIVIYFVIYSLLGYGMITSNKNLCKIGGISYIIVFLIQIIIENTLKKRKYKNLYDDLIFLGIIFGSTEGFKFLIVGLIITIIDLIWINKNRKIELI